MLDIGDVIELIIDIPKQNLRAGIQGTIVHHHTPDDYEIEFVDSDGETIDLVVLRPEDFIAVWRSESGQWVTVQEQVASIIARLPDETAMELLDYARFLSVRRHKLARQRISA
mgnify:CR=1 FL=1